MRVRGGEGALRFGGGVRLTLRVACMQGCGGEAGSASTAGGGPSARSVCCVRGATRGACSLPPCCLDVGAGRGGGSAFGGGVRLGLPCALPRRAAAEAGSASTASGGTGAKPAKPVAARRQR